MIPARTLILFVMMVLSTIAASKLTPTTLYATNHYANYKLEDSIPRKFGDWQVDATAAGPVASPDVEAEISKFYSEVVARTYVNSKGTRVMLSLAYGGDQGRALQVHKPEVCYEAQGFKITFDGRGTVESTIGNIPVRRLVAIQGGRNEPITYWIRSGNQIVTGWYEQNKARLISGLISGEIADGLLVRVSTIDPDKNEAYRTQDEFIQSLIANTKSVDHAMLVGSEHLPPLH